MTRAKLELRVSIGVKMGGEIIGALRVTDSGPTLNLSTDVVVDESLASVLQSLLTTVQKMQSEARALATVWSERL